MDESDYLINGRCPNRHNEYERINLWIYHAHDCRCDCHWCFLAVDYVQRLRVEGKILE